MKKFNNKSLKLKWIELILSIYNGDYYYDKIRNQTKKISMFEIYNIINNQIKTFKIRDSLFKNLTINNYKNFYYMEKLK